MVLIILRNSSLIDNGCLQASNNNTNESNKITVVLLATREHSDPVRCRPDSFTVPDVPRGSSKIIN